MSDSSSTPVPIENLALKGGGIKGLAYIGALKALHDADIYAGIKRVSGSSAGGIVALLIGLGFSVEEITDIMKNLNFLDLMDPENPFWLPDKFKNMEEISVFLASGEKKGVYRGKVFLDLAESLVAKALPEFGPNATFGDLKRAIELDLATKGYSRLKNMIFTGTNLSTGKTEYFSFDNKECLDMPIALAVRITMSFPGAFHGVKWKDNFYVDGGVGDNLPIQVFDQEKYLPKGISGNNPHTLGFNLVNADEKNGIQPKRKLGFLDYFKSLIKVHTKGSNGPNSIYKKTANIIDIYDEDVSTLDFALSEEKKNTLISSGKKSVENWIKQRETPPQPANINISGDSDYSHEELIVSILTLTVQIRESKEGFELNSDSIEQLSLIKAEAKKRNIDFENEEILKQHYHNYISTLKKSEDKHKKNKKKEEAEKKVKKELSQNFSEQLNFSWVFCQEHMMKLVFIQENIKNKIEAQEASLEVHNITTACVISLLKTQPIGDMVFSFFKDYQELSNKLKIMYEELEFFEIQKNIKSEKEYLIKIQELDKLRETLHKSCIFYLSKKNNLEPASKGVLRDFISETIKNKTVPLPANITEMGVYLRDSTSRIKNAIQQEKINADTTKKEYESLEKRLKFIEHHDFRQGAYDEILDLERALKKTVREHFNVYCKIGSWLKKHNTITYGLFNWFMRVTPGDQYKQAMNALENLEKVNNIGTSFKKDYFKINLEKIQKTKENLNAVKANIQALAQEEERKKSKRLFQFKKVIRKTKYSDPPSKTSASSNNRKRKSTK